ncbi:CPBP family intramembrane glutamic endopeptidase [Pseudomonas asplenii]|uniref:CPBP family intramembrane glutamic endopeptidase n=1 Tax=Pseudomonas asplenii TaxID=53407 RepID=UPI00036286DA|nr:type II CAAX endopeptidase family protein [Pseudomonas fuscovaginae]
MKYEDVREPALANPDRYRFWPRVGMAILAMLVFLGTQIGVILASGQSQVSSLEMLSMHAATAVLLSLLAWLQFKSAGGLRALAGHDLKKGLKTFFPMLLLAYLTLSILDIGLGLGREDFMIGFFQGLTPLQVMACLVMLVLFPPISEELLFRHFLMRLFPLNRRFWQAVAVAVSSGIFVAMHTQYEHWPTLVLIGALGVILSVARIQSGGLLLPLVLHSLAEVVGMSADWLLAQFT